MPVQLAQAARKYRNSLRCSQFFQSPFGSFCPLCPFYIADRGVPRPRSGRIAAKKDCKMERKKFAEFIKALKEANKRGENVDAIMKAHDRRTPCSRYCKMP